MAKSIGVVAQATVVTTGFGAAAILSLADPNRSTVGRIMWITAGGLIGWGATALLEGKKWHPLLLTLAPVTCLLLGGGYLSRVKPPPKIGSGPTSSITTAPGEPTRVGPLPSSPTTPPPSTGATPKAPDSPTTTLPALIVPVAENSGAVIRAEVQSATVVQTTATPSSPTSISASSPQTTQGAISPTTSVVVATAPSDMSAPDLTAGDGQVTVTFSVPAQGTAAIVHYDVAGSDGAIRPVTSNGMVSGLSNGVSYTFQIRACSAIGCGNWSAPSPSVVPAGLPTIPAGFGQTDASLTAIRVGWQGADGNGRSVTGYQILLDSGTVVSVDTSGTWVHGGLGSSQSHTYAIRSVSSIGVSGWSSTVTGRTNDAPSPPTFAETTGGISHTWTNWTNAGGTEGPTIASHQTVQIACRLKRFRLQNGNDWWYRIAESPWNSNYYVSADAFFNGASTSGPIQGTPYVDPGVALC